VNEKSIKKINLGLVKNKRLRPMKASGLGPLFRPGSAPV